MTPQSREKKNGETAVFRHRWHAWKVVRSIAAVRQRPKTPPNWRCSFAFFESFLWHFNKKQRAEMIFRLSMLVSCKKKQENGSGKPRSLHAPLKFRSFLPNPHCTLLCSHCLLGSKININLKCFKEAAQTLCHMIVWPAHLKAFPSKNVLGISPHTFNLWQAEMKRG